MTADEAKRYSRDAAGASAPARLVRRITREFKRARPVLPMDDSAIDRFASRAIVSIDRAKRELGFSPSETRWPPHLSGGSAP
jgi:hypothetical protein